ncbi:orotate phosphoribosyltransferase [Patescibacteria group bacterium]|nr:orotate phosphoribosyltransferase [Patescibacteria group bacterium]MBU1954132.1 orotate phosphoribosyltransferase [Patescibacteria group bacterium]
MQQYKKDFIEFLVRSKVLKFGDFTLKSGRKCPYFLNFGDVHSGGAIAELGKYYAQCLQEHALDYDVLFGPAYKGIPISVATSIALAKDFGREVDYSFNRKEAKDHGEGGLLVGAKINADSKVVILDDVMTAGTALRESLTLLSTIGDPHVAAVLIACDRMERGQGSSSAALEVKEEFGIDVYSIVNLAEIIEHLHGLSLDGEVVLDDEKVARIEEYRREFGV